MSDLHRHTADRILGLIRSREISAVEAVSACLDRIERLDGRLGAFRLVLKDDAMARARAIDVRLARGEDAGPLAGLPVAVKDVLTLRDHPTTCGSRILENFVSPYDATAIERLHDAGAVIVGKTNMDEFAMGSSTENSAYEKTRNPWDPDRVPGGSSGGSAAAVAAEMVPISLGTDTGGSIRQPAAFCGVAGLKSTYGRVSRYGLVAFASSLDQIGPFARSVADLGLALRAIAGRDPRDSTSASVEVPDFTSESGSPLKSLRLGIPREYFPTGLDPEIAGAVRAALRRAEELGARVEEVSLPHTDYAIPTYYIIATAEASSNLARYDGARYGFRSPDAGDLASMYRHSRNAGFGKEVKRRIMLGTYVLSSGYYDAYYLKAQKVRTLLRQDFERAFEKVDLIATPTTPSTAFRFGDKTDDPLQMYLSDIFTATINLAGLPALSLPCGLSREGLPIGLQLIGPAFGEQPLLRAGAALEETLGFRDRHRPAGWDA
ncbi:MAG TPA: Asp-tRNA(Asn)/Glu-tRNA(Gln) amidotransferase subunit GatA [Candidatus Polarisedimenticolia bacterium]|nr:Asp-tRNA(Asn)/Glu-tRNA(Gln) amidotransferase subunit GatA [Candidatus Polarisedimenticolia bacterium]